MMHETEEAAVLNNQPAKTGTRERTVGTSQ